MTGGSSARRGRVTDRYTLTPGETAAVHRLAAQCHVPVPAVLTAAVAAVVAADRGEPGARLVHTVDPRFSITGDSVVTCLVNSVLQTVDVVPYASVRDLVATVDRGYVGARRRQWFREELLYREMFRSGNPTSDLVAVNILRQRCAPELLPFLTVAPEVIAVGPVEGTTVQFLLSGDATDSLTVVVWEPEGTSSAGDAGTSAGVADRISGALRSFSDDAACPAACAVGAWEEIRAVPRSGGTVTGGAGPAADRPQQAPACWTDIPGFDRERLLSDRPGVRDWADRLSDSAVGPGAVLVFHDDGTEDCMDLVLASHLHGCGYSPCQTPDELPSRVRQLQVSGVPTRIVAAGRIMAAPAVSIPVSGSRSPYGPYGLRDRLAYAMPTSGTTGPPKLVGVTHRALAAFLVAMSDVYGWGPDDMVLESVPLTSDISVEVVFGAVLAGAEVRRTGAEGQRDPAALLDDALATGATVLDVPTAVWALLAGDAHLRDMVGAAGLRQVIIGGEEVDATALRAWRSSPRTGEVQLLSTYGPTETTVVVTALPLTGPDAHRNTPCTAVGDPLIPGTVHVMFGEIVITGDTVMTGYLGDPASRRADGVVPGVVRLSGRDVPAFATGDRVARDRWSGNRVFAGRRDALVKIGGRRVDTAAVRRGLAAVDGVAGVDLAVDRGRLTVRWFRAADPASRPDTVRRQLDRVLSEAGVPSWSTQEVDRLTGGPVATPRSPTPRGLSPWDAAVGSPAGAGGADTWEAVSRRLAEAWSRVLGRPVGPHDPLTALGVASLDIVRLLPETRRLCADNSLRVRDLLAADSAASLVSGISVTGTGQVPDTVAATLRTLPVGDIDAKLAAVAGSLRSTVRPTGAVVVVLGATGTVGSGFRAVWPQPGPVTDLVTVSRGTVPDRDLRSGSVVGGDNDGVHVLDGVGDFSAGLLRRILGTVADSGRAVAVVNCTGNTSLVLSREWLSPVNIGLAGDVAAVCRELGLPLLHLSSVAAADPVHPYAHSKLAGERRVAEEARGAPWIRTVRLPRVLPLVAAAGSEDVLVSVADACRAAGAVPQVDLVEEVLTTEEVAVTLLDRAVDLWGTVAGTRGEAVPAPPPLSLPARGMEYVPLLRAVVTACGGAPGGRSVVPSAIPVLPVEEWYCRLEDSAWAAGNPGRWAVVDEWTTAVAGINIDSKLSRIHHDDLLPPTQQTARIIDILKTPEKG